MNKWEKEVQQSLLDSEEAAIKALEAQYKAALKSINEKVKLFQADIDMLDQALEQEGLDDAARAMLQSRKRSKIYQKQYQQALQSQVNSILDKMQGDNYATIDKYLKGCYETGYIGTMYDIAKQGVPIIAPINQAAVVKAVLTDSKIKEGFYNALGVSVKHLKKTITQEVSRGIASSLSYSDIARNINNVARTGLSNAKRIARTEGHRIQQTSTRDAQEAAKAKGADVVKMWDAALDSRTRDSHRRVDGEIRELDEPFSNGLMFPGDPAGEAAEVINCRCTSDTRARWALDEGELKTLQERAEYFGLDKSKQFEEFKNKYLQSSMMVHSKGDEGDLAIPYSERGLSIDERLQGYLSELKANSDYIERPAGEFKVEDLAILTTETGVEYTTVTINGSSFLIRGAEKHTTIPQKIIDNLVREHGTLDYHSHPFIGDLRPSPEDQELLKQLTWQETSVIIEPTQRAIEFNRYGAVGTVETANYRSEEYYATLIWDDFDVD